MAEQKIEVNTDVMDLVIPDEQLRAITGLVPTEMVKTIALRMAPMLPDQYVNGKSRRCTEQEVILFAEIALSRGHNPLSVGKSFYEWLDPTGRPCFEERYASIVRWASDIETFSIKYFDYPRKEKKDDFLCDVILVRDKNMPLVDKRYSTVLNALLAAKVPISEALRTAEKESLTIGVSVTSRVKYDEVYKEDGTVKRGGSGDVKGWQVGVTRARIRGLRAVVSQVYGEPTFAEMARIGLKATRGDIPQILAEMPDEVAKFPQPLQQKWVDLDERRRENDESERLLAEMLGPEKYTEYSKRRQQKNTTLMRGEILTDDWLDDKNSTMHVKLDERRGPDWRDATDAVIVEPAGSSEVNDLMNEELSPDDKDLIAYATSMGAVVEERDDVGVAMSIGDVKDAMVPIYANSATQLQVIKKLYGDDAA